MPVIAIDLGGTKIEGAVVDSNGRVQLRRRVAVDPRGGDAVALAAADMVAELVAEAPTYGIGVDAVGVCVPGIVNRRERTVWAPNIAGWEAYPLYDVLVRAVPAGVTVHIDSDRSCSIYGETWLGAAADSDNAVFVAVGTGIGLGVKVDGRVLHGHGDIAGATGWMALEPPYSRRYDACGCFEYYASGAGIGARARGMLNAGAVSELLPGLKTVADVTAEDVFDAYAYGDSVATAVIDRAVEMWGMAAANYVSLFNPEVIVWGGGVFGPAVSLLPEIERRAAQWAQPVAMRQVRFVASQTSFNAILTGAAYIALRKL